MNILFTILAWLPLAIPIGILVTIYLIYRRLNKGNYTDYGPVARPPSLMPWDSARPSPDRKYDPPPIDRTPPMNGPPFGGMR